MISGQMYHSRKSTRSRWLPESRHLPNLSASDPGSGLIDKDVVLEADTDVVGYINGGHTALPDNQIRCICMDGGNMVPPSLLPRADEVIQ